MLSLEHGERLRRLAGMAMLVLEEALTEARSATVAAWVLNELEQARDPALTLAQNVVRALERWAEVLKAASARPLPKPRQRGRSPGR
jgi:hypothetical protein